MKEVLNFMSNPKLAMSFSKVMMVVQNNLKFNWILSPMFFDGVPSRVLSMFSLSVSSPALCSNNTTTSLLKPVPFKGTGGTYDATAVPKVKAL